MLWDVYLMEGNVVVKGNRESFTLFELEEFYAALPPNLFAFSIPAGSDLPDCLLSLLTG